MRTLGVVLAGGRSRRFGSDKAAAIVGGMTLLDLAVASIRPYCDDVAVAGRSCDNLLSFEDWPRAAMGPLGGLAGALNHAEREGFDQVLSVPVDCGPLPGDLFPQLEPAPSCIESQPVIGLWPAAAAAPLRAMLQESESHAVRRFCQLIGARLVTGVAPANINSPDDLERLAEALSPPAP